MIIMMPIIGLTFGSITKAALDATAIAIITAKVTSSLAEGLLFSKRRKKGTTAAAMTIVLKR